MSSAGMPASVQAPSNPSAPSPAPVSVSPCGACKFLRRKCTNNCIFAPYFPPDQSARFANVHKIFGASNVGKLLQDLPVQSREDAVNSLSYEADARINDPVYGCVGALFSLQQQVAGLQAELAMAQSELTRLHALSGQAQAAAAVAAVAAGAAPGGAAMNQFMPVVQATSGAMVMASPYSMNGAVLGQPPTQGSSMKTDYDALHPYSTASGQQPVMPPPLGSKYASAGNAAAMNSLSANQGGPLGSMGKHGGDAYMQESSGGAMQPFPVNLGMMMAVNGGHHQPGGAGIVGSLPQAGYLDAMGASYTGAAASLLPSSQGTMTQRSASVHAAMHQSMNEDGTGVPAGSGGTNTFS